MKIYLLFYCYVLISIVGLSWMIVNLIWIKKFFSHICPNWRTFLFFLLSVLQASKWTSIYHVFLGRPVYTFIQLSYHRLLMLMDIGFLGWPAIFSFLASDAIFASISRFFFNIISACVVMATSRLSFPTLIINIK